MALTLAMLTVTIVIIGILTATSLATEATSTTQDTATDVENNQTELPLLGLPEMMMGVQRPGGGLGCGRGHRGGGAGGMGNIEVSSEYTETVNAILEADTDVQNLVAEGYNVTLIRPIIKTVVEADGTITTKATTAVVILQNGTSGYAVTQVDISQAKVTQIVIFTKTIIDKTTS